MTSAQLGKVTIEYEVDGPEDGEPMLLLMGLGAQLVAWPRDVVDGLTESGFRVIRMDNRDIGLSTKTEGPVPSRAALFKAFAHRRFAQSDYLLSDMAKDAVTLLDHLDVPVAHVVGVSMGGMIAQQLTIDHPERVLSLCSIMSNTGNRRHGIVSPRLLPTMALSMTTPRPEDPAEAERLGVAGFRLIAGPHFDADEIAGMVRSAISRNVNPLGTIRQLLAIQASPDRTPALARGARADPGDPRPARPPGPPERRHRDRTSSAGSTPADVPRHGARPAGASTRRDRRGDHSQRGAGPREPGAPGGRVGR